MIDPPHLVHMAMPLGVQVFETTSNGAGSTRLLAKVSAEQDFDLGDLIKSSLETQPKATSESDAATSSTPEVSNGQGVQAASKQLEQTAPSAADQAAQSTQQAASTVGQQTEQAAAAPTQALQEAAESTGGAAQAPSPEAAASAIPDAANTALQLPDIGTDAAASLAADTVSQAQSQSNPVDKLRSVVTDSTQGALDTASEATASASKALSKVTEDLSKGLSEATEGLGKGLSDVTGGLGQGISGVTEDLSKGLEGVLEGAAGGLNTASEAVSGAASSLGEQVSGVASTVSNQVGSAASGALDYLPPDVREALIAATTPVVQALADPRVGLPTTGLTAGVITTLWWRERFGGYAGIISADSAADLLEYENSLLVDIRSEESRLTSGTPDLRFGARRKGVVIPLGGISRRSGTQLVKADIVPFQITALLIGGLNKVDNSTRIIILDDFDKRGIKLARAVSSETGLRAFVLQNGIRGWAAAGLGIKSNIDYDSSPLDDLSDQVQGRIVPTLRDPVTGVAAITGTVLAATAIYDVHRTLQFVGSLGVLLTIGTIPIRYNSLEEAYDDYVRPVARIVGKVTGTVSGTAARAKPAPQPATPVTAEVVDDSEEPRYEDEDRKEAEGEQEPGQQADLQAAAAESSDAAVEPEKEPANSKA